MKRNITRILKFLGFLSLGILLLYLAFRGMSLENLKDDFRSAKYSWVLLSLAFAFLAYIFRAIRWKLIIEPLNYHPSLKNTFYALMVGYLANFAFPRIGEITRCATLAKKEKIPADKLIGTVIVERAVDLLTLFLLLIILIIFRFETFGAFFRENLFVPMGNKISDTLDFSWIIWIIGGSVFILIIVLYFIFRHHIAQIKLAGRIKDIIKGVLEGLKTIYRMKRRWEFIFHSLFIWFLYWIMTWVVVFALPSTSHLGIIDGLFILVIGGLGMSVPVQSGIGAYHWIVSRGLVIVYGTISLEQGLVFATISHESQSLLAIILGGISFALLIRKSSAITKPVEIPMDPETEKAKSKTA